MRSGASSHFLFLRPNSNFLRGIFGWRVRLKVRLKAIQGHHTLSESTNLIKSLVIWFQNLFGLWSLHFCDSWNLKSALLSFGAKTGKFFFECADFGRDLPIFAANCRRWHWFSSDEIIQIPWILKGLPIQSYTIENFDKSRSPFFGNFAAVLRQIW